MCQDAMAIFQFNSKHPIREHFDYPTFNFDGLFSGHVKISGSPSVIKTVCSKWADGIPSFVTTVQPSPKISTAAAPALTIGSMASVMPARNFGDVLFST